MISSRRLIAYGAALTLSISSAPLATALTVGASIGGVDANASLGGSGVSASVGVGGSNTGDSGGSTGGTGAGSGGGSPQGGGGYMYGSAAQSGANAKAMGYPSGYAGASAAQYQRLIGTTVLSAESLPLGTIVGIRPQKNGPPLVILSVNPALGMKQDNVTCACASARSMPEARSSSRSRWVLSRSSSRRREAAEAGANRPSP